MINAAAEFALGMPNPESQEGHHAQDPIQDLIQEILEWLYLL